MLTFKEMNQGNSPPDRMSSGVGVTNRRRNVPPNRMLSGVSVPKAVENTSLQLYAATI